MRMRATNLARVLLVASLCAAGAPVYGQWTAIRLHSPTFTYGSWAAAAWGPWQGGSAWVGNADKPVLWHAASNRWINLAPGPGEGGAIYGAYGDRQVGTYMGRAALWYGTPESQVDLHPGWAVWSKAVAVWGDEQVGVASTNEPNSGRAALWRGSAAATYVNLHPGGTAVRSEAKAVAAGQQAGTVEYPYPTGGTVGHAALWSGTAASFVDLNPPGAQSSAIRGMCPGQQVGGAQWAGFASYGGYWTGTPESFVALTPSNNSTVLATCGSAQAGFANLGIWSAAVWFGTAESMVNLHQFLPPGQYFQSEALAVSLHNGRYYVAGTASNVLGGGEAWLWVGGCYADCNRDGRLTVPDFTCFQTRFVAADPYADCTGDGNRTVADFTCFQSAFVAGCP